VLRKPPPSQYFIRGSAIALGAPFKKILDLKKIIRNYCEILETGVYLKMPFPTIWELKIFKNYPTRRQPWESAPLIIVRFLRRCF
jgi:protein involved in temperature-dependent protein secretion